MQLIYLIEVYNTYLQQINFHPFNTEQAAFNQIYAKPMRARQIVLTSVLPKLNKLGMFVIEVKPILFNHKKNETKNHLPTCEEVHSAQHRPHGRDFFPPGVRKALQQLW